MVHVNLSLNQTSYSDFAYCCSAWKTLADVCSFNFWCFRAFTHVSVFVALACDAATQWRICLCRYDTGSLTPRTVHVSVFDKVFAGLSCVTCRRSRSLTQYRLKKLLAYFLSWSSKTLLSNQTDKDWDKQMIISHPNLKFVKLWL